MPTFFGPPAETEPGMGAFTLGLLLEEVASRHPAREALCLASGDATTDRWSYGELLERSRQFAKALIAAGAGKGTRVALLMGNRPEWVAAAFGVAMTGSVLVPVNTLFEAPEIEYVLHHSDTALLVHQERLSHHPYDEQLRRFESSLPYLARRICFGRDEYRTFLSEGDSVDDRTLNERCVEVSPYDDALVIYTSGSTGRPKGVLHGHRAACLQSWRFARQLGLDPSVRVWSAYPFFWTAGFCMVMGATLASGGSLVLQELFDPGEALALIERERVTTPFAWPHQQAALEAHPDWTSRDLSSIRHAESFSSLGRHRSVMADDSWSPRSAYGLTETFTIISSVPANTPAPERAGHEGAILPGNAIRIVDADNGESQVHGISGEIRVKGPTLMKGYLKVAPEAVFDEDGFFATGDAGFVDDKGRLHWVGRTSDLIKTGGANVSPVEIENELLSHPDLQSALAVGVTHPTMDQVVVVCAVARKGADVTEADVREFLRGKLASYKLPRHVLFFDESELVLTGSAKIRVDELRAMATKRLGSPS